ncbi:MAG TPA: DUF2079 domain-containing protein [Actinomycetes bacterium]|nr:DUF2079 domain-containing protein [Actinomycetes bacterium]
MARVHQPAVALGLLVATYIAVFGTLTWAQHENFGTFGYDMGLYDQGIWLLSRFREPFVTIRGLNYFEHHVNLITVLFVPAYWLGAGPHFLYLVETVWMALGAVPVYLLARDRLENGWLGVVVAACFLLYPSLEWINWWHFHPDALVITPLLFAWWLATRRRWGWYAVAVGVALACKEDAALAVIMLGLVLAVLGERRVGLVTAAAGAGWFLLATRVLIPAAGGGDGPFYEELFPGFGDSLGEIVWTMAVHPSRLWDLATLPDRVDYYWHVLGPVAFFPLAAPLVLLISLPQTVVNVTSGHALTHDSKFHYTSIVLAGVWLATVEAMAFASRGRTTRRVLVGVLLAVALVANVAWSPSPLGRQFDNGWWAGPDPRHATVRAALRVVPDGAGVSASYNLIPHLTHRTYAYEYPNPWRVSNWGAHGENPPDPATVDYLVIDERLLGDQRALYERLLGPNGGYRKVFASDGIVVARRMR